MPAKRVSRRTLLKAVGTTLGASALAVAELGCAGGPAAPASQVQTPAFAYGKDDGMSKRILVTYATR